MRNIHYSLLLIIFCCFEGVFAQQEVSYTQFWNSYIHTNPATTGLFYKHAGNAHYRNQWDKVNGAPNTLNVNYAVRLSAIHGGVGVSYRYETIGFNRTNMGLVHYAFHWKLGETLLSFGASAGIARFSIDKAWIPPSTLDDPSLPPSKYSKSVFTSNIGIVLHREKWNVGVSCTQLNSPSINQGTVNYNTARHYFLFADYNYDFSENLSFKPQIQVVTDAVKYSLNSSLMITIFKNTWTGINFSPNNYLGLMLGYDFKGRYRVGYGYDYTTNKLSSVSKGTHEIVLSYLLK